MIQLVVVDDHPALRAGLTSVLRAEPGIVPLDAVASADELWPVLNRTRPQVVVLDYHLPPTDGVELCRQIKRQVPAPAVLLYSAYAGEALVVPSLVAGADGIVHKGAPAPELYDAIRRVARGERVMPPLSRSLIADVVERIEPSDAPVLMMALEGTPPAEIAASLRCTTDDVSRAVDRILGRLRVDVPSAA
jgi:DNA-binding NarL/FixJ family response regulator